LGEISIPIVEALALALALTVYVCVLL